MFCLVRIAASAILSIFQSTLQEHVVSSQMYATRCTPELIFVVRFFGPFPFGLGEWSHAHICTYLSWLVLSCFCYFLRWLLQPSPAYRLSICRQSRLKLPPKGVPWETKKAPLQHSWCRGDGPNGEAGTISVAGCCSFQSGARNNLSVAWIGIFAQHAKIIDSNRLNQFFGLLI